MAPLKFPFMEQFQALLYSDLLRATRTPRDAGGGQWCCVKKSWQNQYENTESESNEWPNRRLDLPNWANHLINVCGASNTHLRLPFSSPYFICPPSPVPPYTLNGLSSLLIYPRYCLSSAILRVPFQPWRMHTYTWRRVCNCYIDIRYSLNNLVSINSTSVTKIAFESLQNEPTILSKFLAVLKWHS